MTPEAMRRDCDSALDPDALRAQLAQVRQRCEQLQFALDSRVLIEQSKGVLIALYGCDAPAAFLVLRRTARNRRERIHAVAELIVRAAQVNAPPLNDEEAATLDALALECLKGRYVDPSGRVQNEPCCDRS